MHSSLRGRRRPRVVGVHRLDGDVGAMIRGLEDLAELAGADARAERQLVH